ncbi:MULTISPECIES: thioredoxin [Flavobacterium]|uniref:Thioredoxin n=1 Tax=Flavobacterium hankyongi TaxID=1176532 RepID=A0ABP9A6V0_9FLAO|nr:thioredoxin [Flavobacterium sp. N1846]
MKKAIIAFLCTATITFTSCKGQNKNSVENIEPKVFAEKISTTKNAQVLDVRTPEEYNSLHLDNAINININDSDFDKKLSQLDKNKPVFVYCLAGARSAKAAARLNEQGFTEIYNMNGGITKWNASGLGKAVKREGALTMADYQKLVQTDKKVLIDFNAEWCGPCKKMAPFLAKMKEELKNDVVIIQIDVDKNQELAQEMKIEGLPTLILYNKGKEVWKNLGYMSETDLKAKL